MDADLQDNPEEVPEMIEMIQTQGFPYRFRLEKKRYDPLSKQFLPRYTTTSPVKMSGVPP